MNKKYLFLYIYICLLGYIMQGCGSIYKLSGEIYFNNDASRGDIIQVHEMDISDDFMPVAGAKIVVYLQLNENGIPQKNSYLTTALSDDKGFFKIDDYIPISGSARRIGVEVSKNGYEKVYKTFIARISETEHYFITLVKSDSSNVF